MTNTKVGVIGCGYWGPKLARNFHGLQGTDLAWVADLRPDRLAHMQELYPEVRTTKNYKELLSSDIDAVVVAVPVGLHHAVAMEALRSGKHVLVEKPLAAGVEAATEIAETADKLGLIAMVGHTFQYNPAVNAVRDVIASGQLGQVYYINATRVNLGLLQPDINVIWDLAPHDISILLHVLGCDPHAVSAQGEMFVQKIRGIHEVAYMTLRFPTGILANLRLSWLDPVKIRQITVVGSKKMLVYDDLADNKVTVFDKGVDVQPYSDTMEEFQASYRHGEEQVVPVSWQEPLNLECAAFVQSVRTGSLPVSNAWMGVKVVRVLEMAQKSLLNGGGWEGLSA
ncbi:MAG: Gfo/Idh/MocA family oxidoreductase [Acidobacteriia bacterium]|nr:Gfo/Idh/MocA family oxidoreductase [Terriglobia bacterium]